jgi:hypothetical protein
MTAARTQLRTAIGREKRFAEAINSNLPQVREHHHVYENTDRAHSSIHTTRTA